MCISEISESNVENKRGKVEKHPQTKVPGGKQL